MSGCLRPRHMIALRLLGERGPMTQHAVGVALSLDPSNVVGLLNELEERGPHHPPPRPRRPPPPHRRAVGGRVRRGRRRPTTSSAVVEDDLFKSLTADERATLYGLLSRAVQTSASACEPNPCVTAEPSPC